MYGSTFRPAADLFSQLQRLQQQIESTILPDENASIRALSGAGFPIINIGRTQDTVEVMALAPGVDPKTLDLSIDRGLLIIAGERGLAMPELREGASTYANERFTGKFRRVVNLPEDVDPGKVDASYRDGVLRVTLAKRESSKPRPIPVN